MAKKSESNDRRRRIEEIKKQQKSSERRTTYVFVGVAVLVAAGLIASAVLFGGAGSDTLALNTFGVPQADAGCGDVVEADKELTGQHVGPGVEDPKLAAIGQVSYATTPPTGGDHYLQTAAPNKQFYDRDDDILPERLVHNLEHGYVVVWYDKQASGDDLKQLRGISKNVSDVSSAFGPKFIVAPYTRGDFEGEKNIGMTAWGASRLCDGVSGEAIEAFVKDYRAGGKKAKAPEPNAG
ncbi:MAG TPA: DUF3105 domain-containing protein [Mycobacteriales bacterium]|nr:DUF3105 domain-containing protein [Mycobacteriales bacterium]